MVVIGRGPNKEEGPCTYEGCKGTVWTFDGPWFSSKPKPSMCDICERPPPDPDKKNVVYIGW